MSQTSPCQGLEFNSSLHSLQAASAKGDDVTGDAVNVTAEALQHALEEALKVLPEAACRRLPNTGEGRRELCTLCWQLHAALSTEGETKGETELIKEMQNLMKVPTENTEPMPQPSSSGGFSDAAELLNFMLANVKAELVTSWQLQLTKPNGEVSISRFDAGTTAEEMLAAAPADSTISDI